MRAKARERASMAGKERGLCQRGELLGGHAEALILQLISRESFLAKTRVQGTYHHAFH